MHKPSAGVNSRTRSVAVNIAPRLRAKRCGVRWQAKRDTALGYHAPNLSRTFDTSNQSAVVGQTFAASLNSDQVGRVTPCAPFGELAPVFGAHGVTRLPQHVAEFRRHWPRHWANFARTLAALGSSMAS